MHGLLERMGRNYPSGRTEVLVKTNGKIYKILLKCNNFPSDF
jgi:hypothetical protein